MLIVPLPPLVVRQDEWRGTPSLAHIFRRRFLRDPAWACLPQPPLETHDLPVQLSQGEALAAQVAALSGYMIDSLLMLSFGRKVSTYLQLLRAHGAISEAAGARTSRAPL